MKDSINFDEFKRIVSSESGAPLRITTISEVVNPDTISKPSNYAGVALFHPSISIDIGVHPTGQTQQITRRSTSTLPSAAREPAVSLCVFVMTLHPKPWRTSALFALVSIKYILSFVCITHHPFLPISNTLSFLQASMDMASWAWISTMSSLAICDPKRRNQQWSWRVSVRYEPRTWAHDWGLWRYCWYGHCRDGRPRISTGYCGRRCSTSGSIHDCGYHEDG